MLVGDASNTIVFSAERIEEWAFHASMPLILDGEWRDTQQYFFISEPPNNTQIKVALLSSIKSSLK